MLAFEVIFCVLFGLVFGSFLNVCIVRLPRGESIVRPRSRCFSCGTPIRSLDNIPILSWIALKGRSRCCGRMIPARYPLVEATTAALFVGCLLAFGLTPEGAAMAILCWLLLGLACMDAETYLLPDAFTLFGLALGVLYRGLVGRPAGKAIWHSLLAAAIIGGSLLTIALIYRLVRRRHGMGLGDVKLGALLGAWLGWQRAGVALFLAVIAGAVWGIGWVLIHNGRGANKKAQAADEPLRLPFGAFLASGGIVAVFAGEWLLAWYLHFFR